MVGWLALDVLFTAGVAWVGRRWTAGFDVRGPFLFMSPLYAAALFFSIGAMKFLHCRTPDGKPDPRDVDQIESTAVEFGFGDVGVIRQSYGAEARLTLIMRNGEEVSLPKNWAEMDSDARRFAVVRTLSEPDKTGWPGFVERLPSYGTRAIAMLICGFNLWLILACHGAGAIWFAYSVFWNRGKMLTKADVRALHIMRDLKAAIAFAKVDPMNASIGYTPEQRIAVLRKAAARMGIA